MRSCLRERRQTKKSLPWQTFLFWQGRWFWSRTFESEMNFNLFEIDWIYEEKSNDPETNVVISAI